MTSLESQPPVGAWGRLVGRVFPKTPDFFVLLHAQSTQAVAGMEALVEYMQDGTQSTGKAVKRLESQSDDMRDHCMAALNNAFSTPMDREDLYRAISTLDHLLGYAKSTVREMEVLHLQPDEHTLAMAHELLAGTRSLDTGYGLLATEAAAAEQHAQAARSSERNIEKLYRHALSDLFDVEQEMERLGKLQGPSGPATLARVIDIFKRREIYRHLSNAGDRVAHAGDSLHDIVVKLV